MSNVLIASRNWLTQIPPLAGVRPTLNTPSPNQDARFPQRNVLEPQREKFWKCASPHPSSHNVDIDLGIQITNGFRLAGILRNRQHNGGVGITSVEIFTATGATYPPGAWTSRGTISLTPADNNKALDFGTGVTARQIRFAIAASGRYSCKLHVCRATDFLDLGSEGAEIIEGRRRVRISTGTNYVGEETYLEMATGLGEVVTTFRFSHALAATTAKPIWLGSMGGSFLMRYRDDVWHDCVHSNDAFVSTRAPGATALDTHDLVLESQP